MVCTRIVYQFIYTDKNCNTFCNKIIAEQCATVEEHYSCIIDCPELIDPVFKEVLRKDMPEWYDSQLFRK